MLVATRDQLTAALALIELDGIARRLVLCPPDFSFEHLPFHRCWPLMDAIVSDRTALEGRRWSRPGSFRAVRLTISPAKDERIPRSRRNGFSSHPARRDCRSWSSTPWPAWPERLTAPRTRSPSSGARSTTFAVMAVSDISACGPYRAIAGVVERAGSRRRIF